MGKIKKEKINKLSNIQKCPHCGKIIDLTFRDRENYVWKISHKTKKRTDTRYYCSYGCWKHDNEEIEKKHNRQEKARIMNRYNGVLTLPECLFMDELKEFICEKCNKESVKLSISSRDDFKKVLMKYYKETQELLEDNQ